MQCLFKMCVQHRTHTFSIQFYCDKNENLYAFNCKNMLDFGGTSRGKKLDAVECDEVNAEDANK